MNFLDLLKKSSFLICFFSLLFVSVTQAFQLPTCPHWFNYYTQQQDVSVYVKQYNKKETIRKFGFLGKQLLINHIIPLQIYLKNNSNNTIYLGNNPTNLFTLSSTELSKLVEHGTAYKISKFLALWFASSMALPTIMLLLIPAAMLLLAVTAIIPFIGPLLAGLELMLMIGTAFAAPVIAPPLFAGYCAFSPVGVPVCPHGMHTINPGHSLNTILFVDAYDFSRSFDVVAFNNNKLQTPLLFQVDL